jgi:GNAT superfamily N-acetyltransferase
MQQVRSAVRENRLRDPSRVTHADYVRHIAVTGASWVADIEGCVAGFGVADRASRSIWALFVDPQFEGRGIGRALLQRVTDALLATDAGPINLSTEPGTRAERMYFAAGWVRAGELPSGESWLVRNT